MTVEEKRKELIDICTGKRKCRECFLRIACISVNDDLAPRSMPDKDIEKLYTEYEKSKGDKTMEEKTITIAVSEYRFLISKQATLSKLEDYTETHEYLSDDVVRALLGVEKPNPARIESEGD